MKRGKALLALSVATVTMLGTTLTASAATPEYEDLFDAEYYASQYSDVAAVCGDDEEALLQHYLTFGIKEGRSGSDMFDVRNYREKYADLDAAFGDDWQGYLDHYLNFGINEGRDGGGMFDAVSYANRYEDLKDTFGYDFTKLREHYELFGEEEGRNAVSQDVKEEWDSYSYTDFKDNTIVVDEDKETGIVHQVTQYAPEGYLLAVTNYDEQGRIVDWTNYNAAGEVVYQEFYIYDEEDGMLAIQVQNSYVEGTSLTREYAYDMQGRIYSLINHLTTEPGGEIQLYYTAFEYDGDSERVIRQEDRDENGNLMFATEYEHYASGAQKTAMYYDCNGVLYYSTEYYDMAASGATGCMKAERFYYESGQLKSESLYDKNYNLVSYKEYNEDGTEK